MKREEILLYISNGKFHLYILNKEREIIEELDTSTFFKYGEISNVSKMKEVVNEFINNHKILEGIFKPNLYILYNDICSSDSIFLYQNALAPFNYNECKFIGITRLINSFKNSDRIVLFDKDYYTIFKYKEKMCNIKGINFEPIFIGENNSQNVHYSDDNLIWNTYKSNFTNE